MERPGERTARPLTGLGEENAGPVPEPLGALEGSPPWLQPPNSGWERIRELFRDQKEYPEESVHIIKAAFTGSLVGFVYGGIPGYLNAKKQYIEQCEGELYHNRLDAVQSMQRSAIRGFIRYGWRWSWRVAAFVLHLFPLVFFGSGSLGTLLMGLQKVSGETFIERKKRKKSELHALKMAKW
uniref:Complex I assembly factor TIMMDC1, mitochondrial n=1 Tax=Pseudonaja textilis TaxID=8673 RepID=A0A670XZE3_PSETE